MSLTPTSYRRWKELAAEIVTNLQDLARSLRQLTQTLPFEPRVDSVRENSDPAENANLQDLKHPVLLVRSENRYTADHEAQEQANSDREYSTQRQMLRVQKFTCVATIAAFFAAAYYARIAKQQNDTMSSTLGEIQKQTVLLRQETVGTLAASVVVESPRPNPLSFNPADLKRQGVFLQFANVGKVSASKFVAKATMTREALPNYKAIDPSQTKRVEANHFQPYTQMPPDIPGFRTDDVHIGFDTAQLTPLDVQRISGSKEVIEIKGTTRYNDGFGNLLSDSYCFMYFVEPIRTLDHSTTGGGAWGLCDDIKRAADRLRNQ
jgi:hypothetical protein